MKQEAGTKPKDTIQEAYFATVPGYRRAKNSEVTPEMREAAKAALKHPLRAIVHEDGYIIVLETHINERLGKHKGASIFLPE